MLEALARGARVERLASPLAYVVAAGALGTVVAVYPCDDPEDATRGRTYGYAVHWDARPPGSSDFTAGSRIKPAIAG